MSELERPPTTHTDLEFQEFYARVVWLIMQGIAPQQAMKLAQNGDSLTRFQRHRAYQYEQVFDDPR